MDRNNLDYSLAWALVTPVVSVFLMGFLYGALYSGLYLAFVAWFAGSNLGALATSALGYGLFLQSGCDLFAVVYSVMLLRI